MLITSNKSYKGKENPKQSSMLSVRLKEERVISTTTQPCPQWATPLLSMGHRKIFLHWKIFVTQFSSYSSFTTKWGGMSPEIHIWWHSKVVRSRTGAEVPKSKCAHITAETAYDSMTPLSPRVQPRMIRLNRENFRRRPPIILPAAAPSLSSRGICIIAALLRFCCHTQHCLFVWKS